MEANDDENITNYSRNVTHAAYNITNTTYEENPEFIPLHKYYVPLLILFCLASIVINIKVLLTVHWLRRPISPTLHISLSLAAADAISSALLGIGLFINSYLVQVFNINLPCYVIITIEMYRLTGIIITVVHLLALSMNHWLGILKPLHYTSIMTTKKVTTVVSTLWIVPIVFFNVYFFTVSEKPLWERECDQDSFLFRFRFRITFSLLFFIPLVLMIFFYTHILLIVKKQQKVWANLSRSGSKRSKSLTKNNSQQRRTMEGNIKAIFTTLLILGSCLIGWMPAVIRFLLVCKEKCIYTREEAKNISPAVNFFISYITHFLLISKTLANPIIYSARMIEIKEATRRMNLAITGICCKSNRRNDNPFETQSLQLGCSGSVRATALYRLNGSSSNRSIRRSQPNTLV